VPVDFKTMVHSIHAGGFRETPFVVIGRDSSINDFSGVRFPATLSNCVNCHIDANGKGTFELPLKSSVLGTTIRTQSVYQVAQDKIDPLTKAVLVPGQLRTIDVDPTNDLRISPIAATCSACHDKAEVRSHMIRTGGASFSTPQSAIGVTVKERCVSCHGPGREEDVRRAHEIRSTRSSGSGSGSGDAAAPRHGDDD
jgi:OmcA/MtrC family decaheme c-type cytochrome